MSRRVTEKLVETLEKLDPDVDINIEEIMLWALSLFWHLWINLLDMVEGFGIIGVSSKHYVNYANISYVLQEVVNFEYIKFQYWY